MVRLKVPILEEISFLVVWYAFGEKKPRRDILYKIYISHVIHLHIRHKNCELNCILPKLNYALNYENFRGAWREKIAILNWPGQKNQKQSPLFGRENVYITTQRLFTEIDKNYISFKISEVVWIYKMSS